MLHPGSPMRYTDRMRVGIFASIRLKLLKIGALATRSIRRIRIAMASSCPDAAGLSDEAGGLEHDG